MKSKKLGCLGIIAIIVIGGIIVSFFDSIGKTEIPNVNNMTVSKANTAINDAGFTNIAYQDKNGNDLSDINIDDWTITGQSPSEGASADEDEEILLTCQSPSATKQQKIQAQLEKKLSATSAWTAVQIYGESEYPYGFDLHLLDVWAEEAMNKNTWYLKTACDVTNQYGVEKEMACEAHVTGTDNNPRVVDFKVY